MPRRPYDWLEPLPMRAYCQIYLLERGFASRYPRVPTRSAPTNAFDSQGLMA